MINVLPYGIFLAVYKNMYFGGKKYGESIRFTVEDI